MIIVSFNLRGCGGRAKRKCFQNTLKLANIDVCFVQETKLHNLDSFVLEFLWRGESVGPSSKWVIGRSGELLIFWKLGLFDLVSSFVGEVFLGVHVIWKGFSVYLVNSYSCLIDKNREFWDNLCRVKESFLGGYWCVGVILMLFVVLRREKEGLIFLIRGKRVSLIRKLQGWI